MIHIRFSIAISMMFPLLAFGSARPSITNQNTRLSRLVEKDWSFALKADPQKATTLGVHVYDGLLTDYSLEAIEHRKDHTREALAEALLIDREKLSKQGKATYDLFVWQKKMAVEGQAFPTELIPINQFEGMVVDLTQLPDSITFRNRKTYRAYLARLAAIPVQAEQVTTLLKLGAERRFVPYRGAVETIPDLIGSLIPEDASQSPLLEPFKVMPASFGKATRDDLSAQAQRVYQSDIVPALKRLQTYYKTVYLPACRNTPGCDSLPNGKAFYEWSIRSRTTTNQSPQQIHETGLAEVARIHAEMKELITSLEFKGDFKAFLTFLKTDPRFYYTDPAQMLKGYQKMAVRANKALPSVLGTLPTLHYGIKRIPVAREANESTAYYDETTTRDGFNGNFYFNCYKLENRPIYNMEALFLHEAVPGHHIQLQLAKASAHLPSFRRHLILDAYCEGWALYAERLGYEMGFYQDPYSRFGQLNTELWRAARLVVDTGVHAYGWSKEDAVSYLTANTAYGDQAITAEVNRYASLPAQALSYTLGMMEIMRLRKREEAAFGSGFDLRKFHDAILESGPITLEMLDQNMAARIQPTGKR